MDTLVEKIHSEVYADLISDRSMVSTLQAIGFCEASPQLLELEKKYPLHKVVTGKKITMICKKYKLVFGEMKNFTDVIPKDNLIHVKNFVDSYLMVSWCRLINGGLFGKNKWERIQLNSNEKPKGEGWSIDYRGRSHEFFIVCPEDSLYQREFGQSLGILAQDPIILACEYYNPWSEENLFIVVTAWGNESKEVVNPSHN